MEFVNTQNREYRIRLNEAGEIEIDHENRAGMSVAEYCEYAGVPWEAAYLDYMESEIISALQEGCGLRIDLADLAGIPMDAATARALRAYARGDEDGHPLSTERLVAIFATSPTAQNIIADQIGDHNGIPVWYPWDESHRVPATVEAIINEVQDAWEAAGDPVSLDERAALSEIAADEDLSLREEWALPTPSSGYCIRFRLLPGHAPHYWDGGYEGWTTNPAAAEIYLTRAALPEEIPSYRGLYSLSRGEESYEPPAEYWTSLEESPDDQIEWLADEYRDSLYWICAVDEDEELMRLYSPEEERDDEDEEIDYSSLSSDEREQMAMGLETSLEVMDALQAIAEEDGVSVLQVWQDGYTPVRDADAVLEAVRDYIRETIPEDDREEEYYWGAEGALLLDPTPYPDAEFVEDEYPLPREQVEAWLYENTPLAAARGILAISAKVYRGEWSHLSLTEALDAIEEALAPVDVLDEMLPAEAAGKARDLAEIQFARQTLRV